MKQTDYDLVKKFYDRLTAEDFTRRAEDPQQAQQMMFAFSELIQEAETWITN